jgi:eukaryotic-like serine/threonine-protein kinase
VNNQQPILIGGRYELGELLGRGGMAEVRKGTDTRLGRVVAVKRLRTDLASDATFQARFRREAQSAASLNHPAIVAVYDTGEEPAADGSGISQPYIVMEYVAARCATSSARVARSCPSAPWRSPAACSRRSTTATARGSSTATSSPAT